MQTKTNKKLSIFYNFIKLSFTPLMMAVASNSSACLQIFLENGGFQIKNSENLLSIEKIAN